MITFFLFGLWTWPRYGKDSIFHELFKKQHRGTPKRNKSNKRNSWRLASGTTGKSNIGLWHKNKAPQGKNMGYEAGNLQIYSFSWERPKEFLRKCFCCVLQKIDFLSFWQFFHLQKWLKNGKNRKNLIFSIWAQYEYSMQKNEYFWNFMSFLRFLKVFLGF